MPAPGWRAWDLASQQEWAWDGAAWTPTGATVLRGSATYDPPSLDAGERVKTPVAVPGAAPGDFVRASFTLDLQGVLLTAWASAADQVSVRFQNDAGAAVDLGSGTFRVKVEKA